MKNSLAALTLAVFGNIPGLSWIIDESGFLAEPMGLVLWGVALITLSSSLRRRSRSSATMGTSLARPA